MVDFTTKTPEVYYYLFSEQSKTTEQLLPEAQQQDPLIFQIRVWKMYKNRPITPTLTLRTNKGLYTTRVVPLLKQKLVKRLIYFLQETAASKIRLPHLFVITTHSLSLRSPRSRENI